LWVIYILFFFFIVKKFHIGSEMIWIYIYRWGQSSQYKMILLGWVRPKLSILRWYQSLLHDTRSRLLSGFWLGHPPLFPRASPIVLGVRVCFNINCERTILTLQAGFVGLS
jgi:hypothetical protein